MLRKLRKLNDTTYGVNFERARVEVGDLERAEYIPCCKMYNFEDETSLKVSYADRPYSLLSPDADEVDKVILTEVEVYEPYEVGKWYEVGDKIDYYGDLFEVIQAHTSQEDWIPSELPALYKVSTPQGVIGEWVQPAGSHDAYAIDTKVSHNGKIWVTIIDANVWEPGVYGWEETTGTIDVECYSVDGIGEQNVEGFEFEVILRGKPESNVIKFAIETDGLNFYYQPELTQAEIDEGVSRPEEVIGSYAVYHATCGNMHKGKATAEKYKTGKAFHIYRPKVVDANGDWIWGVLNIDAEAGILSITVDEQWLDSAVYPVRVDPTFGYVDANGDGIVGASELPLYSTHTSNEIIRGTGFECSEDGAIISLSAYFRDADDRQSLQLGMYEQVSGDLLGISDIFTINTDGWEQKTLQVSVSVVSETNYVLCARGHVSLEPQPVMIAVDRPEEPVYYRYFKSESSLTSFPDPFDGTEGDGDFLYSIYGTYEEAPAIPVPIITATQENGNIRVSWTYP